MAKKFNIALIVGTRPEAIKMTPLMLAAHRHPTLALQLIATGQQDALFDEAIATFGIAPDAHLGAAAGASLDELCAALTDWLRANRPNLVLVQGDTNTALAGAQAAAALGIQIGHVEAGLRTHNPERPFPEENNRVAIGQLATLHFAPAQRAADNLARENVRGTIHITGNTGIDALLHIVATIPKPAPSDTILITCHRRENFGAPLLRICAAFKTLATDHGFKLRLPVHPNPNVRDVIVRELGNVANISLIPPLTYPDMINAIRAAPFVLSDSGGLQEECAMLGIPLLLMREETERQELVESGNVLLVGSDTDRILSEAIKLRDDPSYHTHMSQPTFPYGNGDAATKIIKTLEQHAEHLCTKSV
jgi:UDP-N-acetylglucosamine 2-epimerase (non-hydrolysing)